MEQRKSKTKAKAHYFSSTVGFIALLCVLSSCLGKMPNTDFNEENVPLKILRVQIRKFIPFNEYKLDDAGQVKDQSQSQTESCQLNIFRQYENNKKGQASLHELDLDLDQPYEENCKDSGKELLLPQTTNTMNKVSRNKRSLDHSKDKVGMRIKTKLQLKHSCNCVNNLFIISSDRHEFPVHKIGNPANDNYIFLGYVQTLKKCILTFLPKDNASGQKLDIEKIKFKFGVFISEPKVQFKSPRNIMTAGLHIEFLQGDISHLIEQIESKLSTTRAITSIPAYVSSAHLRRCKTAILNGVNLRGSALFAPYMIKVNGQGQVVGGMHHVFMQAVSKAYNFTYDLDARPGRGTGHLLPNGTWTHLMADIVYGASDFVTVTAPTYSRYGVIDMTSFTFTVNVIFYTRFPSTEIKWQSIVRPFTPIVWQLLGLSFLAIFSTYYIIFITEPNLRKNPKGHEGNAHIIFISFMIPFTILLDQDWKTPKRVREISALWMFFILILSAIYKDQLVGFMTLPEPSTIPRDFTQLHQRPDYKIFFFYMASTPSMYFKSTQNPIHKAIASRFIIIRSGQKCVMEAALTDKSVCVGLHNQLGAALASNLTINFEFQPLIISRERLIPFFACFGLPINSIYTAAFDRFSSQTTESGLGDKWYYDSLHALKIGGRKWLTQGEMRQSKLYKTVHGFLQERERSVQPLQMQHFPALWGAWIFGTWVGILAFAWEIGRKHKSLLLQKFRTFVTKTVEKGSALTYKIKTFVQKINYQ